MTRYFFDSTDGDFVDKDEDGIELSSDGEARRSALDALPDMARAAMPNGDHRLFTVTVRREGGGVLYRASMEVSGEWVESWTGAETDMRAETDIRAEPNEPMEGAGRTSDSRTGQGATVPNGDGAKLARDANIPAAAKGDPEPSSSPSALGAGRMLKKS